MSASAEQRKPDWILKVQSKKNRSTVRRIGAGWNSDKGHINIIVDFGCMVTHDELVSVILFPNDTETTDKSMAGSVNRPLEVA